MNVRFSRLAIDKLERLSEYLSEEWSVKSNLNFLKRLDLKLQLIRKNPKSFPESELQPGLRKCVVTKQTSLLYEIQSKGIFVLTIIDTRQDQVKIKEEIGKDFTKQRL
ncbi:MAG: type II toxin-antitoxin system RelE/ParE family toxin [Saprospiraceae bacterium]|nr:type II toxin-antitoxin system RelE/ParE family toxin [Saprospiraceae bacterium]